MCIYYTNRSDLHFDSQEHIIPAAIGGRAKLPNDYVSREFNNDISKLEREFIQESIVAMPREIEGPGKRGKLTEKYETKSDIFVMGDANDPNKFALGFIKKGTGYEIPQVLYDTSTGVGQVRVHDIQSLHDFKQKCNGIDIARLRTIIDDSLPKNIVLFGIQENIEEHYDFFFAKNSLNNLVLTANIVQQFGEGVNTNQTGEREKYQPIFSRKIVFDISHLRIYGKIAFNYLAYRMGKDFVLRSSFNPLRKWISQGGQNNFASLNTSDSNPFIKANITLPESFHLVHISKIEQFLLAKVFLYGALCVDLVLCDGFTDPFEGQCLICDWKNRKEYELIEYLRLFYNEEL